MDRGVVARPELLFQKVFEAFLVEQTHTHLFKLFRRELLKPLFRPVRNRTEPLLNLATKDRQLALLAALFTTFLLLAPEYFVVINIVQNRHLLHLLFYHVAFSKSWPKRPLYALSGSGQVMAYSTLPAAGELPEFALMPQDREPKPLAQAPLPGALRINSGSAVGEVAGCCPTSPSDKMNYR